MNLKSKVH